MTVFAIKRLRQVIAVRERALCLSLLFSAELKLVLPSSSFFVVPPVSFPQGHFFLSLRGASFTAVEICILVDSFHA